MTRTRGPLSFLAAALLASQALAAPTPKIIKNDETPASKSERSLGSEIGAAIVQAIQNNAPAATPAQAAQAAAPAPAPAPASAAAPAPQAASSSSLPVDIGNSGSTLDLLLTTDLSKWLEYFGISSSSNTPNDNAPASSSAPAPAPAPAPASTSIAYNVPNYSWSPSSSSSAPVYTPPQNTYTPTTPTTSTALTATASSVPSGDIYAEIGSSPGVDASFAKLILDKHNEYRADHGVGALSWDSAAFEYAQNNANNYDCSGTLTHTHGQYGENLAAGFSDGPSAVTAWYDEGSTYNYQSANTYDHFTQVVWKGSTKVGCAYKNCKAENWGLYVICEYDPPGNVIGYNKVNVLPSN